MKLSTFTAPMTAETSGVRYSKALRNSRSKSRYGGGTDLCRNNVVIRLENGKVHSTSTSIDVLGWDGAVGECHDCKADSRHFRQTSEMSRLADSQSG
jgi:hypothetical protein